MVLIIAGAIIIIAGNKETIHSKGNDTLQTEYDTNKSIKYSNQRQGTLEFYVHNNYVYKFQLGLKRKTPCGKCSGCSLTNCGTCVSCKDMIKFGGKGIKKKRCLNRKCTNNYTIGKSIASG